MTSREFRTLRIQAGCTQKEWAKRCFCSPSHVANVEGGQHEPSKRLAELARQASRLMAAPGAQPRADAP